jgi:hypothetical protein
MRISRNSGSSGRPLSTADLATAAGHSNAVTDDDEDVLDRDVLDESAPTRPKDQAAEPVSGRSAADERLRASRVEADLPPHRTEVRETDRPPTSAPNRREEAPDPREEAPVALFTPEVTETYRSRWISIQSSFVDDPRQAVRNGDELVAQVMTNLANSFAEERHRLETQLGATGEGSTENLRVALRRYRSFFDRLLTL